MGSALGNHVLVSRWSGTTSEAWLDGTVFSTSPGTIGTLNTSATRMRVFANAGTSAAQFYPGVVAQIVVTEDLTTLQRQKIEAYLLWQQGLQGVKCLLLVCGSTEAMKVSIARTASSDTAIASWFWRKRLQPGKATIEGSE